MPKAMVSFECLPLVGAPKAEVYRVVDAAIAEVEGSGVTYMVGPAETSMAGELDTLLDVVKRAIDACRKAGAARLAVVVKVLTADDEDLADLEEKVAPYRARGH
ncbi:thiamine-binding protein [Carboxydochorda subterranea]|uniref:Thiamine-binding protein n=1 Tax=Carboxydichorda subterranea TaxID=3109565 RepID=A0ABZ1BXP2_9FIRM|nr:thiamine-binding protein [Limnochorda sp. L945t]WRP17451.1 thiamine-binding protein [Limnochorda sp. L945t]